MKAPKVGYPYFSDYRHDMEAVVGKERSTSWGLMGFFTITVGIGSRGQEVPP